MVGHHLPMILAVGLRVEDQNLMEIKCALSEIIDLEGRGEGSVWVTDPHASRVQDFCREVEVHPRQERDPPAHLLHVRLRNGDALEARGACR